MSFTVENFVNQYPYISRDYAETFNTTFGKQGLQALAKVLVEIPSESKRSVALLQESITVTIDSKTKTKKFIDNINYTSQRNISCVPHARSDLKGVKITFSANPV